MDERQKSTVENQQLAMALSLPVKQLQHLPPAGLFISPCSGKWQLQERTVT
jgi:hypothetical protein